MVGIKKLGCLGVLSRKTSKNPQKDESYQEGFRTDPYSEAHLRVATLLSCFSKEKKQNRKKSEESFPLPPWGAKQRGYVTTQHVVNSVEQTQKKSQKRILKKMKNKGFPSQVYNANTLQSPIFQRYLTVAEKEDKS